MRNRNLRSGFLSATRNRRRDLLCPLLTNSNLRLWWRPGLPGSGTTWTDYSANSAAQYGTIAGTYSWSTDLKGEQGVLVNSTGNYVVSFNNIGITGDNEWTMALWLELKSTADGGICGFGNAYVAREMAGIYLLSAKPLIDFAAGNYLNPPVALTTGKLYFLCATKTPGAISNTTIKVYYDAVEQAAGVISGSGTPSIVNSSFYLNRDANYGASGETVGVSANALYSQAMVFNRALLPGEVRSLYEMFR